jgi:hypothetical protein
MLFQILKWHKVEINEGNFEQIYDAVHFLEFSSDSIKSFFQNFSLSFTSNDISQISSASIDSIESILSSHFLHLRSENQLFDFVQNLIKENRENLNFLRYVYFGLVDCFHLMNLIHSIQFNETDHCLFEHFQNVFFSNYLLSFEKEREFKNLQMFLFSENIEEYFEADRENKEIKSLFEFYPIILPNVLESANQTYLFFTLEQIQLIQHFKYIEVITGKIDNFGAKSRLLQENHIFIFIPNSITSSGFGCFRDCSSLSQIKLPNSITSSMLYALVVVRLFLKSIFQIQSHHSAMGVLMVAPLFLKSIF